MNTDARAEVRIGCHPTNSSAYAGRRPAWCGGAHGGFRRMQPAPDHASGAASGLCMLTPVHVRRALRSCLRMYSTLRSRMCVPRSHARPSTCRRHTSPSWRRGCSALTRWHGENHLLRWRSSTTKQQSTGSVRSTSTHAGYLTFTGSTSQPWWGRKCFQQRAACSPRAAGRPESGSAISCGPTMHCRARARPNLVDSAIKASRSFMVLLRGPPTAVTFGSQTRRPTRFGHTISPRLPPFPLTLLGPEGLGSTVTLCLGTLTGTPPPVLLPTVCTPFIIDGHPFVAGLAAPNRRISIQTRAAARGWRARFA